MRKWVAKAIVQKIISFFPFKEKVNYFFQKYVTKGAILNDDYFELKLLHAKDHIHYFEKYKRNGIQFKSALELGTGWYPIVPISLFLVGFDEIVSIDTQKWLSKQKIIDTLIKFENWQSNGKLKSFLDIDEKRWNILLEILSMSDKITLDDICNKLNFNFIIADARKLPFENESFELVCSNNTFEHIPESILKDILKEFHRLVKNDGVMSHFIDLSDHFAHFDQSINIYNFLRFSPLEWKYIDNSIQPQNRLRFCDYENMYRQLGIKYIKEQVRPGFLEELEAIKIHKAFKDYTKDELAVSHGYFIS